MNLNNKIPQIIKLSLFKDKLQSLSIPKTNILITILFTLQANSSKTIRTNYSTKMRQISKENPLLLSKDYRHLLMLFLKY